MRRARGNVLLAVLGSLLAFALAFGAGYRLAAKLYQGEAAEERARRYEAVAVQVLAQGEIRDRLEREIIARRERVRVITQTQIKEVPIYVTAYANAACNLTAGFVRMHNRAAAGEPAISEPAAESVDAPAGVALDYAASVIVENYGTCNELRDQVIDWQRWYAEAKAKWDVGRVE